MALSPFGPRLHAAIAYLSSVHRGSRRGVAEIVKTLLGVDISLGGICNVVERVTEASQEAVEEIRASVANASVLHADETGWRTAGKRRWLWVFVGPLTVYFHVAASRGATVLSTVLGSVFRGILVTDDYSAYRKYHHGIRQLCWAHLIRKLKGIKDSRGSPDAYAFSRQMLREAGRIFTCWHAFVRVGLSRKELFDATHLIRARMKRCCRHYENSEDALVRTQARRFLKNWDHLFIFLLVEGVGPTNNTSERTIRPAVQWRKTSYGNQTENGELFTSRILTLTRTCRLQDLNAFEYLACLMNAHFNGCPMPSLVR